MEVKRERSYQRLGRRGQLGSILVYFSVTMIKHSDQKQFREGKGSFGLQASFTEDRD